MTDAMAGARGGAPGDAEAVLRLAALLADSVTDLERAGGAGAGHLVELVRAAGRTLEAAARPLAGPAGAPGARAPEATRQWLHELRTLVTAITGWARMLGEVPLEATRIRATEAIERNAKRLAELLAHRPP
jgi:signal transduction histidine kinase